MRERKGLPWIEITEMKISGNSHTVSVGIDIFTGIVLIEALSKVFLNPI